MHKYIYKYIHTYGTYTNDGSMIQYSRRRYEEAAGVCHGSFAWRIFQLSLHRRLSVITAGSRDSAQPISGREEMLSQY